MNLISVISAALLLIAIPKGLPYEYYTLLRWVICASGAWHAYSFYEKKNDNFAWIFGFVAILFNPFVPFHLSKDLWVLIDLATAILFIVSMKKK